MSWQRETRIGGVSTDLSDKVYGYSGALKVAVEYPVLFKITFSKGELFIASGTIRVTEDATLTAGSYYDTPANLLCGAAFDGMSYVENGTGNWQCYDTTPFVSTPQLKSPYVTECVARIVDAGYGEGSVKFPFTGINIQIMTAKDITVSKGDFICFSTWWLHRH